MSDHKPISGLELQQLKTFWQEEDERNGGWSDMTRCILEIERLQGILKDLEPIPDSGSRGLTVADVTPDFSLKYPKPSVLERNDPDSSC